MNRHLRSPAPDDPWYDAMRKVRVTPNLVAYATDRPSIAIAEGYRDTLMELADRCVTAGLPGPFLAMGQGYLEWEDTAGDVLVLVLPESHFHPEKNPLRVYVSRNWRRTHQFFGETSIEDAAALFEAALR